MKGTDMCDIEGGLTFYKNRVRDILTKHKDVVEVSVRFKIGKKDNAKMIIKKRNPLREIILRKSELD